MMTCIIIEDQPPAQRILKTYIQQNGQLKLLGVFGETASANDFMKTNQVDLLFLDIHLPRVSGIEFLKRLHIQPKVILTTAFSEYALEGYELNVLDYLLKPFSFSRFETAVQKAINDHKTPGTNPSIFIKSGHDRIKILIADISYIMANSDYTEIVSYQKKHLSSESLKYWSEQLKEDKIVRVHKSYLVNLDKISKTSSSRIVLNDGVEIPIGRAYKERFKELLR